MTAYRSAAVGFSLCSHDRRTRCVAIINAVLPWLHDGFRFALPILRDATKTPPGIGRRL